MAHPSRGMAVTRALRAGGEVFGGADEGVVRDDGLLDAAPISHMMSVPRCTGVLETSEVS